MARRRPNVFSLAFLDIMSCGFGAVVLLFMIINHETRERSDEANTERLAEVTRLEMQVLDGKENLAVVTNSLDETTQEIVVTQGLAARIIRELSENQEELASLDETTLARVESVNNLKADVQSLDEEVRRLRAAVEEEGLGDAARSVVGEGDRQYLTGLRVGGERVLFLLDASASMLDETIVNVIRRRNMSDRDKVSSRKWQRALLSVDWLAAQLPESGKFQIYVFNVQATPVIEGTEGKWLEVNDTDVLDSAIGAIRDVIPENGTSLQNAFETVAAFSPPPDNIMLITDGLPTQGRTAPIRKTVSADARLKHFSRAADALPRGIPVNTILLPMEGDPRASSAYWQLAQATAGSFLAPARDWP